MEIDSTFYACPSDQTVSNWACRTPENFILSVKVPQTITHEKVLENCELEFQHFLETMRLLGPKLGPIVFQFPFFNDSVFDTPVQFLSRLKPLLRRLERFGNVLKFVTSPELRVHIGRVWDSQRGKPIALGACDVLCDVTP